LLRTLFTDRVDQMLNVLVAHPNLRQKPSVPEKLLPGWARNRSLFDADNQKRQAASLHTPGSIGLLFCGEGPDNRLPLDQCDLPSMCFQKISLVSLVIVQFGIEFHGHFLAAVCHFHVCTMGARNARNETT
jgi:hypothetical protein